MKNRERDGKASKEGKISRKKKEGPRERGTDREVRVMAEWYAEKGEGEEKGGLEKKDGMKASREKVWPRSLEALGGRGAGGRGGSGFELRRGYAMRVREEEKRWERRGARGVAL